MKKLTLIALFLVLYTSFAFAECTHLTNNLSQVNSFACSSDEMKQYVVANHSSIWRSHDSGASWELMTGDILQDWDAEEYKPFSINKIQSLSADGDTIIVEMHAEYSEIIDFAISCNGGDTWEKITMGFQYYRRTPHLLKERGRDIWHYLDSQAHLRSEDGLGTWDQLHSFDNFIGKEYFFQDVDYDSIFYHSGFSATVNGMGGVGRSDDYGTTWSSCINSQAMYDCFGLLTPFLCQYPDGNLLAFADCKIFSNQTTETYERFLLSADRGESWSEIISPFGINTSPVEVVTINDTCSFAYFDEEGVGLMKKDIGELRYHFVEELAGEIARVEDIYYRKGARYAYIASCENGYWRYDVETDDYSYHNLNISGLGLNSDSYVRKEMLSQNSFGYFACYSFSDQQWSCLAMPASTSEITRRIAPDVFVQQDTLINFIYEAVGNLWTRFYANESYDDGQTWQRRGEAVEGAIVPTRSDNHVDCYQSEVSDFSRTIVFGPFNDYGLVELKISYDYGRTWVTKTIPDAHSRALADISMNEEEILVAIPCYGVYLSRNEGDTWEDTGYYLMDTLVNHAQAYNDVEEEWYLVDQSYISRYDGETWRTQGSVSNRSLIEHFVAIPGDPPVLLYRHTRDLHLRASFDRGRSSRVLRLEFPEPILAVGVVDLDYDKWRDLVWVTTMIGPMYFPCSELTAETESVKLIPAKTNLGAAYPNPFNPSTVVPYCLASRSEVELVLYDIQGREAKRIREGMREVGAYQAVIDGSDLASGVYFLTLFVDGKHSGCRKITLIK